MKARLDQLLVARGLAASRTVAQALVLEGKVRVAGQTDKVDELIFLALKGLGS